MREGWHDPEPELTWSSKKARLIIPLPEVCSLKTCVLKLKASALEAPLTSATLGLSFEIDGEKVDPISVSDDKVSLPVSDKCAMEVVIHAHGAARPADVGISEDTRQLGIALQEISIVETES